MKPCAPMARAAPSISAWVAPGRPSRMLSATEPAKRKLSWVTVMTARRRSTSVRSRRSTPSSSTQPSVGSQKRAASRATVVLPAPVAPTTASVWPAGISEVEVVQDGALPVAELHARRSGPRRAAAGSGVGSTGSGTLGGSASTPESFSVAAAAAWNRL